MTTRLSPLARHAWLAVGCLTIAAVACRPPDWRTFRHDSLRSGSQPYASALTDPARVAGLDTVWSFQPPSAQAFRASPVVYKGRVYIGNGNGYLYALDAATGALLWQYPAAGSQPLTSQFTCNPSSRGIASSAAIAKIPPRWWWLRWWPWQRTAVIFGAPDRSFDSNLGSGRLFALDASTGSEIWKSPVVARLTGLTSGSTTQLHEQIGYSAPLVYSNRIYIGVANHCDNPIQRGKVVAVYLRTGAIDGAFSFFGSGPPRGGGVWSSVAGYGDGIFVTTGNTLRSGQPEPPDNHGLSFLRLDRTTGSVGWKWQPVPYAMDFDPDWAAGATVMRASCGDIAVSTMKDGWTWALTAASGPPVRWGFPAGYESGFSVGDGTVHGDIRYLRPGASWGDVYLTMTGGLNVTLNVTGSYRRLHALNACASTRDRIRWILDVPGASGTYALGPATVSRGIVFVGTSSGRLIVIADPSVDPTGATWRCANPDVLNADCLANGYWFVPVPTVLADVQLQGQILTEPVLVGDRVFVATSAGRLYMLQP